MRRETGKENGELKFFRYPLAVFQKSIDIPPWGMIGLAYEEKDGYEQGNGPSG